MAIGGIFAGQRIADGISARDWSEAVSVQTDALLSFVTAVQSERTQSFRAVGDDSQAAGLQARRNETDARLADTAAFANVVNRINPKASAQAITAFQRLSARVPELRRAVDTRVATVDEIDSFYTQLANVVVIGLEGSARSSPDPATVAEEIFGANLMRASDLQSRALGRAAGGLAGGRVLNPSDRLTYARLTGAFQSQLDAVVPQLTDTERARYDKLTASREWKLMVSAEDDLAQIGRLPLDEDEWLAAQDKVSTELRGLWEDHLSFAVHAAVASAEAQLTRGIAAAIAVLIVAAVSLAIAIQVASVLIRRLRSLRAKTLELANQTLPSIVQRLNEGQQVDVEAELVLIDDGVDEIGQVAEAFNTAQRTAMAAAAAEARTRAGINRVFLDIARRSQVVVHQQLGVLDKAEAKQNDPEHLELLFQLDHLATRARRNAENLLILGGGQPGRKWRRSVTLEEIVRSSISETRDFTRVSAVRLPEAKVIGAAVADLIHLLAELIDNATSFSPPDSPVTVRGNLVGKGVVVEVEDQGLGIRFEERERLNAILLESTDFQEMALTGHRHLGLFVVGQLAQRHGIAVNLLESAYGGIKAIALVPDSLLERAEPQTAETSPAGLWPGGRHHRPPFISPAATDLMPSRAGTDHDRMPPWPVEPPIVEVLPSTPIPVVRTGSEFREDDRPSSSKGYNKAPLPRRKRQSHLVSQLRLENINPTTAVSSTRIKHSRSADEARSRMASLQRGTRQGRESNVGPTDESAQARNE